MNEPQTYETSEGAGLTTEQLANAGEAARAMDEPRSFEAQDDGEQLGEVRGQDDAPIFAKDEAGDLRGAWDKIQAGFVDEPRKAVQDADHLVAKTMQRLAEVFADERSRLESQWDRGDDVSTEDLRVALQRYRAFFGRLLSV